jgi:hypothetical protein
VTCHILLQLSLKGALQAKDDLTAFLSPSKVVSKYFERSECLHYPEAKVFSPLSLSCFM